MTDIPMARALRVVERLIARRVTALHEFAQQPSVSRAAARGAHQRADELGRLIGEIRAARIAGETE
jgi:hypothetical protein